MRVLLNSVSGCNRRIVQISHGAANLNIDKGGLVRRRRKGERRRAAAQLHREDRLWASLILDQLYRYFHNNGGLTIVPRLEELFAEVDAGHHIAAALLQPHVRVVLKAGGGQSCRGWWCPGWSFRGW